MNKKEEEQFKRCRNCGLENPTGIDNVRFSPREIGQAVFENSEWLDSREAAAYLRISVGSLRNMTSNGKIPFHKLEKRNRFLRSELRELLLSKKRGSHGN